MSQYDPFALKTTGLATSLGTDTCRADRVAAAGLTTAGITSGYALQVSAALTVQHAVNTSTDQILGIYEGTTGSIVRSGAVVAVARGGIVLAAGDTVYLSDTAGQITNVKPTADVIHELGVVIDAATSTILLQPKPPVALPATRLLLDARSNTFIVPGRYTMPLPTTDAELVAQGWPSIAGAVDGELWLCDEAAGNLVGEINGYALAPQNAPLQNRDFHGLPYGGTLWGKKAVEGTATARQRFHDATVAELNVGNGIDFTLSWLIRGAASWIDPGGAQQDWATHWVGPGAGTGFIIGTTSATALRAYLADATGGTNHAFVITSLNDGALHLVTVAIDRNGNVSLYIDDAATQTVAAARPGDLTEATKGYTLGSHPDYNDAPGLQCAWHMINIGVAASRVGHDALWAALNSDWLGTDNTYARTNPLTYPIAASRVATSAAGMLPTAYAANASVGDNALRTSVVAEEGITFEAIGSTDPYTNTNASSGVKLSVDGSSGMRDGVRQTMGGAWVGGAAWMPNVGVAIVGSSAVAWRIDICYRRALVNTTARVGFFVSGSAGGAETFTLISDAASPVDWTRAGGTATPIRADQTAAYILTGAAAIGDDCNFCEHSLIKSRATATLAWRRVGTAAAAATSTASLSYTNALNARFSPTRGRMRVRVSELAKKEEQYIGAYAAAGGTTRQCCYSPGAVWVTSQAVDTVRKLNADTGALIGDYATGNEPQALCYDPTTNSIWICNYNAGGASTVTKLNASTGALIGTYAVGNGASGICTDGTNIWVSCWVSNQVYKLLAADGSAVGNYATGVFPSGNCYANGSVWITNYNDNTITKLTAATGGLVGTYATGANPAECCYDGTNVWIANTGARTCTVLTEATGALAATYTIAVAAAIVSKVMFDGTYVWVDCYTENVVAKVNIATGAVIAKYGVGAGPLGCCWDGRNVWVSSITANTITKLGTRQVLLAFGAEATQGALWLDYEGDVGWVPLMGTAPQLRLRMWDDVAALIDTLLCGALTTASHEYIVEWSAALARLLLSEGGVTLDSYGGAAWTPETAAAVTPLYVGSDATPANAARCNITLLGIYDY